MSIKFDPYTILGVSNRASDDDIKRTYRRLAQRFHPDSNPNNPGAILQFQDINTAYNLLSDPLQRGTFDSRYQQQINLNDASFNLRVTPSKRTVYPLDEEQVIYLLAEIIASPNEHYTSTTEANLNLTLVLDVSNSMSGTRIRKVIVAAQRMISEMNAGDYISIVTFNDRASVIIPATRVEDQAALKSRISLIKPSGGTEIFQGLSAGVSENRKYLSPRLVNHVILLTDGHTFGDQDRCLELAEAASNEGISISAMGLGNDWNDTFLDQLASRTGANSMYIQSEHAVSKFFNDQVKSLSDSFADRMSLSIAPDPDMSLDMAFMLSPNPQPVDVGEGRINLGSLQKRRPISLLFQFVMPAKMQEGFRTVGRLVASGEILHNTNQHYQAVSDISIEVSSTPSRDEPPAVIMDALSKLTLYRIQEKAHSALESGDTAEATRRLETLATRLLELGETSLAHQTIAEAEFIAKQNKSSSGGFKNIKYSTRALIGADSKGSSLDSLFKSDDSD